MPERTFRLVTTAEHARALASLPANVEIETDVPFDAMRRRLEEARVVALPVVENSYSGATTVLLQAMALAQAGRGLADAGDRVRLRPGGR